MVRVRNEATKSKSESSLVLVIMGHELLEVRSWEEAERVGLLSI